MSRFHILTLMCCQLIAGAVSAQQKYAVSLIPAALLKDASVIVRQEEQHLQVKSDKIMMQTYSIILTIFNPMGDHAAELSEYYDPFCVLSNLKASLYDAAGVLVKTYKAADFKDLSLTSSGTLFDNYRTKRLTFLHASYPYTIAYSFDRTYEGYLTFPSWQPVTNFGQAVEKSSYTLQIPRQLSFRYQTSKGLTTDSVQKDQQVQYKWSCSELPAIAYEAYSTGVSSYTPWVKLAPDQFDYDHTKGQIKDWKQMGTWIDGLNQNGKQLSVPDQEKIRQLIAGAATDKEKIRLLYHHLQSNTRYVSIQLGIGGFRPIAADKVAAVSYGDCKALSNYMMSMLAVAGIQANLVVLGSGRPSLDSRFSSFSQANHMILCVPGKQDTTWLECTSGYSPAGYIGYANAGRQVLLIKAGGGELVGTPVFRPEHNTQHRKAEITLSASGEATIQLKTTFANAQYEDNLYRMLEEPSDQRKRLLRELSIPNLTILSLNYQQPDRQQPLLQENISLQCEQMTANGGGKIFLSLNLLNRKENVPQKITDRRTSFSLPYGYEDLDEVCFKLPDGYTAEFIPEEVILESPFGKYSARTERRDHQLVYTRKLLIRNQVYTATQYNELVNFYKKIYQADKQKAILVRH